MRSISATRYATGFKRTIDHLKSWRVQLPENVTHANVWLAPSGSRSTGARIFVCENVPQLKYHNPKLKVSVNVGKDTLTSPSIKFKTNEESLTLDVAGLSAEEIKALVRNVDWTKTDP
jgi:hypothetical protein